MKKLLLVTLISLISLSVISQSCLPEGIIFTTQEQIDNFQTDNPGCTEIEGDVSIEGFQYISNLDSLIAIHSIGGSLIIKNNTTLANFTGLDSLTSVEGYIWIGWNPLITDFEGLNALRSVNQGIKIIYNEGLTSFNGLGYFPSIEGELWIENNDALINLNGLEYLSVINGNLTIYDNDLLDNLSGLLRLSEVGGDVMAESNSSLRTTTGMDVLNSISGDLIFSSNNSLTSLNSLNSLTSIGGWIFIVNNDHLSSLIGLDNIVASSITALYIYDNDFLQTCDVTSVCNYLSLIIPNVSIENNYSGCNTEQEVKDACGLSIKEKMFKQILSIQPNPFSISTALEYELKQPEKVILTIYNHLGQLGYKTEENQPQGKQKLLWNAENLPDGIYYYRLQAGEQFANGKMVKVR